MAKDSLLGDVVFELKRGHWAEICVRRSLFVKIFTVGKMQRTSGSVRGVCSLGGEGVNV